MFDLHTFTLPSLQVSTQDATVKAYKGQQSKGIFRCLISNGQRRVICEGPLPVINDNILIFFLEFNMRHESIVHAMPHCLFIIFIEDNLQKHYRAVSLYHLSNGDSTAGRCRDCEVPYSQLNQSF